MMDDLISKKSLLSAYDEKHKGPAGEARKLIEDAPSIPAVPLDKLCVWLETNARLVRPDGSRWNLDWMKWKEELEKWMEGLDGTK